MLEKIEDFFVKGYIYIKNHATIIVMWVLTLLVLFLLGDKFEINQQVFSFFSWLVQEIWINKIILINLVLAIGSTISAIFAVIISIRANKISKLALESERPVLVADYVENDNKGNKDQLTISNEGLSDAVNIKIYLVESNKSPRLIIKDENLSLVPKAGKFSLEVGGFEKNQTYIIFYENSLNGSIYKYGFEVNLGSNNVKQIGFADHSPIDFQFYQSFEDNG